MKPYAPILIVLMFLSASFVGVSYNLEQTSTVSSNGNTLYVGGSGPGNYTKIQDAIKDASDGDTVFVYNGKYVENLIINKPLNLIGEDKNSTHIDGRAGVDTIHIRNTKDVIIKGFKITNSSEEYSPEIFGAGIKISNSSFCIVKGNNLNKNGRWGILLQGANHLSILENNISHGGYSGLTTESLKHSAIKSNVFYKNSHVGIRLESKSNVTIIGNKLISNGWYGIDDCGEGFVFITQNLFTRNDIGINLESWGRPNIYFDSLVFKNIISKNEIGIQIYLGSGHKILCNNFILNFIHNQVIVDMFSGILLRTNRWIGNYYGRWLGLVPKPVVTIFYPLGFYIPFAFPWLPQFDWFPAIEPYDIEV